jgi:hypothetical protein
MQFITCPLCQHQMADDAKLAGQNVGCPFCGNGFTMPAAPAPVIEQAAAPKRRWLRFSLRTLFIVLTVSGIWLGFQVNWIRQRREFIAQQRSVFATGPTIGDASWRDPVSRAAIAPGLLWFLGEEGVAELHLQIFVKDYDGKDSDDYEEVRLARRLFPESAIHWVVFQSSQD